MDITEGKVGKIIPLIKLKFCKCGEYLPIPRGVYIELCMKCAGIVKGRRISNGRA